MTGAVSRRFQIAIEGLDAQGAYAVVSDVERYPEFLPGIVAARIVRREPGLWQVENVFGAGLFRSRFRSEARPDPPHALAIRSYDGPWRELAIDWRLREEAGRCIVACEATLDFRSPALAALARFASTDMERQVARAFEMRLRRGTDARKRDRLE